jgi:hypothetical protein
LKGTPEKPSDLDLLISGMSSEEIMVLVRGNPARATLTGCGVNKEDGAHKMQEYSLQIEGKNVQFFDPD